MKYILDIQGFNPPIEPQKITNLVVEHFCSQTTNTTLVSTRRFDKILSRTSRPAKNPMRKKR